MRVDARFHNGSTRLRALIDQPMAAARGENTKGIVIPALYVQSLIIRYQHKVVVDARLSAVIARNPYFSFEFEGGNVGEELTIEWVDSADNQSAKTVVIG